MGANNAPINFVVSQKMKISNALTGHAGQYFVCAELSKRGWLASITLTNAQNIDILAHHVQTKKNVAIQVKTTSGAHAKWILTSRNEQWSEPNVFFVLVRLGRESERPIFHIVPSEVVREFVYSSHREWLKGTKKDGSPRKDSQIRNFLDYEGMYQENWDLLLA